MSAIEGKSNNNDEEKEPTYQDSSNENTGTILEGSIQSTDSNKNTEIIADLSENMPQLASNLTLEGNTKESGDTAQDILMESIVKLNDTIPQMTEKSVRTDSGVGCGDGSTTTLVNNEINMKSDNENSNIEITSATSSKLDVIDGKIINTKTSLNKEDKVSKLGDDITDEAMDDEDMELRWDDDDDQDVGDDKDNPSNEVIFSEEQLLQEDTEVIAKTSGINLDSEITGDSVEDDVVIGNEGLVEAENNNANTSDFTENKVTDKDENGVLEQRLVIETEALESSSEINITMKENEQKNYDVIDNPSNKIENNTEASENNANTIEVLLTENSIEKDLDRFLEEAKSKDYMNDEISKSKKDIDDKSENFEHTTVETDNVLLEDQLLKNTDRNIEIKNIEINANTDVLKDKDLENDDVLERKLLEELDLNAESEKEISEMKVSMDMIVNEEELLRDDTNEDITNAMDVDNTDKSIDNNTRIDTKNTNTPIVDDNNIVKSIDWPVKMENKPDLRTNNIEKQSELEKVLSGSPDPDTSTNLDRNESQTSLNESILNTSKLVTTDHGVGNPNIMQEIPSRELLDSNDIDISMNLDQNETMNNSEIVEKIDEDITHNEKAVNQEATMSENVDQPDDIVNQDKSIENEVGNVRPNTIEENMEIMFADDESVPVKDIDDCKPSSSQALEDVQPSTSNKMTPDTSDEVPEVSDSLGLLAESAGRLMEDDEDDNEDSGDDDDFEDESSNLVSAEQSEDSNPPQSETEPVVEEKGVETPEIETKDDFQFKIFNVESTSQEKVEEKADTEVATEFDNVELQTEAVNDEETKSAVNALLKDAEGIPPEVTEETVGEQMDIETVKLSDTSDNEVDDKVVTTPVEKQIESTESNETEEQQPDTKLQSPAKQSPSRSSPSKSPSKMKKLEIKTMTDNQVVNIVDLEESSSSEDDLPEVKKQEDAETLTTQEKSPSLDQESVTNVNIPSGIEVVSTSGRITSEMVTKEGEVVISGVPKPPPLKPARLNTSEVSIKTVSSTEPLVLPETKINEQTQTDPVKPKLGLEIFSLDSDDEDSAAKEKPPTTSPHKMTALELEKARESSKCINYSCTSGPKEAYRVADAATVAYYDAGRKRRAMVCQTCAEVVEERTKKLITGIKNLTPLLDLDMGNRSQDLVEISDSDSEEEDLTPDEAKITIGEKGAKFLEDNLAQLINETWIKYEMDTRLKETQILLEDELETLDKESKEIDKMLNECQIATDKLRCDLYATFEQKRQELPSLIIYDVPGQKYIQQELIDSSQTVPDSMETRQAKRRMSTSTEMPAKRPAIPLGYAPLDADTSTKDVKPAAPVIDTKLDDDKDISVVKLSAESAPADLPPPGEISRPPLRVGMPVYAMKNAFGPWLKGRVLEIQAKNASAGNPYSLCLVKFDHKTKGNGKVLAARCIAYAEPADVRMTIGTRLIALFKDSNKRESYYSGVVAEIPNPVNNYRYLVFFDDGYAQYVQHTHTRLVCESSPLVWEEVHPFSREFVKEYLMAYPERPMVRLHEGQHLKTEWNGKWWSSRVTRVDASLAQVMFVGDGRREWIYRGSTRLAPLYLELRAAERHRPRPMPRSKAQPRSNMPYVEYTRSDEQESKQQQETQNQQQQNEEIRRQRAVAKKSTSIPQPAPPPQPQTGNMDNVTSRVVYYTPKSAVKPYKMTPHKCGPKCKRSDVLTLKDLRTYNPLAKPLLSGWERQIVRFKGHKEVMYRAPCGRRLRNMRELHYYLRAIESELPVDLFDFHHGTHCLAEFVLNKCLVGKKDLSHGKENVPVPCVNYYDDSLPEFCSYNTERTPTAGVPLNLDPEFLCGCDCTDDCQDKSKCACWKMTLEGARTIGLEGPNLGYVYKRLPEPLPSGIYECNSRCKCKNTCLNRVAQHPLQLKLQVFKTMNRGWGIRALNDVPKGSFLCVYAGNLLTDATANLDGLNEGDEYLAELDYIEVVEQMKEGYEEDIPEADKKLDKKDLVKDEDDDEDEDPSSSDEEDTASKTDKEDDDFRPGYIGLGVMEFNKRLRRRDRNKKDKGNAPAEAKDMKEKDKDSHDSILQKYLTKETNGDEDCITISDDEEVREPSRFTVQAGMGANEFVSKYKSVRSLFGKDEACYIMDAKVQGNIGRYLNHSCCPNVFVQNVFVDTHDPRFPWVAFFALSHIKAGTELTWNYNYDVGSVPGKILYCYCGAPNCRGRLL